MSLQLMFSVVLTILCLKQLWIRRQNRHKLSTKKCIILYGIILICLIHILEVIALHSEYFKTTGHFASQILFFSVFFYFIRKYYKMTDSLTQQTQSKIVWIYGGFTSVQVGLMLTSYFVDKQSRCQDLMGIWIRMIGSIIGFTFVSIGSLYYKKFSIQKKNFISLFTIEQEQGIKNFLDQEDKLEDLLILIVVYVMSQFLSLCVLIYYEVQMLSGSTNSSGNQATCSILPPSYLDSSGDNSQAGEVALKYILSIFITFLPEVYLFNLFKYKKPRTDYSNDLKKSMIQNEEMPAGFGRNIQFNNNISGKNHSYSMKRDNKSKMDSSNLDVSATASFISMME